MRRISYLVAGLAIAAFACVGDSETDGSSGAGAGQSGTTNNGSNGATSGQGGSGQGGATGQGGSSQASTGTGSGTMCGGFAGDQCTQTEWCDYTPNNCGVGDGSGVCRPRPDGCPDIFDPVCGCDGNTYSSDCEAYSAGIDISSTGPCN